MKKKYVSLEDSPSGDAPNAPQNPSTLSSADALEGSIKKQNVFFLYKSLLSTKTAIFAIFPSLFVGFYPILSYIFISNVFSSMGKWNSTKQTDTMFDPMPEIQRNCLYFLFMTIVAIICKFLSTVLWIRIGSTFSMKLKKDLFTNLMKSEVAFFDSNPIGGIMTLLSEDSQTVQNSFGTMKNIQISSFGQSLIGLLLSYVYFWKIALIYTLFVPFAYFSISFFSKLVEKHVKTKFEFISNSMTIAEETIANVKTVRSFNKERDEQKRFMNEVLNTKKEELKIGGFLASLQGLLLTVLWSFLLGQLYWCGIMAYNKEITSGQLFGLYAFLMYGGFGYIGFIQSIQSESKAIASGLRILDLTSHVPTIPFDLNVSNNNNTESRPSWRKIDNFKGKLEFKNVSFKYPTRDVYVLKGVSFVIQPGQISALVGHSGSGKSTCVQLIERYYDIEEGNIEIDGIDIKEIDPHWLHQQISLVSQEPILFNATIRENIMYGKHDASNREIEEAAEISNSTKFINKFAEKYEHNVGEKGNGLSGGQKQRIAIARALIKNPVILITDEATSALDSKSERKVTDTLNRVMENRTSIIIAHRLSTIRNANIIYVFEDGEIKEIGDHSGLIEKKSLYFELIKRQLSKREKEDLGIENSIEEEEE